MKRKDREEPKVSDELWNRDFDPQSKSSHLEALAEQMASYIQSIEHTTNRRLITNAFFISLTTALFSLIAHALSYQKPIVIGVSLIAVGTFGLLINLFWIRILSAYKNINKAKFEIAMSIEKKLVAAPWTEERDAMDRDKRKERKNKGLFCVNYSGLASMDSLIPLLLCLGYLLVCVLGGAVMAGKLDITMFEQAPADIRILESNPSTPIPSSSTANDHCGEG